MRTITPDPFPLFTAEELRRDHPAAFERALAWHCQRESEDPAWIDEHRESLASALRAIDDALPEDDIEGPRRMMAWLENHVLGPLRIPWRGKRRWELARYGAFYRPGMVKPCPWTGYYTDDALLAEIVQGARNGERPADIRRRVEAKADQLWVDEIEHATHPDTFVETADANGWEFTQAGEFYGGAS